VTARRRQLALGLALLSAVAGVACANLAGLEPVRYEEDGLDAEPSDDATFDSAVDVQPPVDSGGDASADAEASVDAGPAGPVMVPAGPPGNVYLIDSTEVTFGQYRAFVAAVGGDAGTQPKICAGNTALGPEQIGADGEPVAGVDWCDARAYCAWAGKRLCGKVVDGGNPGPLQIAEIGSPIVAQFTIACTNSGKQLYPYGPTEVPGNCDIADAGGKRAPVGTFPKCVGGYPGIHDMVGNVFEWIDLCFPQDAGPEMCILQGGAFTSPAGYDCTKAFSATIDFQNNDLGFRCCSR
jgi:formylglycine-generating enzyme